MSVCLIQAEDVARKLGVKASWVRERCRARTPEADRIPHIRLGKYVRFSESAIDEWIKKIQSRPS